MTSTDDAQPTAAAEVEPTDSLARSALASWAGLIGSEAEITDLPTATNPLWRVDVVDRPPLVLKCLPIYPPGVEPVVEHRVLSHLQAGGVRVAVPVITDAGEIMAEVGGRRWSLLPFRSRRPGNHEQGPDAAARACAVGAAIGQLDRALADYGWPVDSYIDDPVGIVDTVAPALPTEATELLSPWTAPLAEASRGLPTQLTHGDCHDGNVLVDGEQRISFIDLDHLPTGPRVRDLAYYLVSRLRRHLGDPDQAADTCSAWIRALPHYVAGYHDAHPLTDHEVAAVVPLMIIIQIAGAHWSLHGWTPSEEHYRSNLTALVWLTERFDELMAAVTCVRPE